MQTQNIPAGLCQCGCGERTLPARKTAVRFGHRKGEPLRFVHGHNRRSSPLEYVVDPATGCWNWQRSKTALGHGHTSTPGMRTASAHRVYYERAKGPIPEGYALHHICENPSCVNPDHLTPLSWLEHKQAHGKLDPDKVRFIRASALPGRVLAARFGVAETTISAARLRHTWQNI